MPATSSPYTWMPTARIVTNLLLSVLPL
jgi:hypothetical protein